MAKYCTCPTCRISPAQPKPGSSTNSDAEIVSGNLVTLRESDTLVHWSSGCYPKIMSTELAKIQARGVNPVAVCSSFYLLRDETSEGFRTLPKQLKLMGLGGDFRYAMYKDIADKASIYLKSNTPSLNGPAEVVVVLGCGGFIDFKGQQGKGFPGQIATSISRFEN